MRKRVLGAVGIVLLVALALASAAAVMIQERGGGAELLERFGFQGAEEQQAGPSAGGPAPNVAAGGEAAPLSLTFDTDPAGRLPDGFVSARTGPGADGTWVVLAEPGAPSPPHVLAQTSTDATSGRFPMAVATGGTYGDLDLSVKFKAISGRVDQAGGLVFRYRDANNYYLVRANALENNYRLYHVVRGTRTQIAGSNLRVTANAWHTLRVVCAGEQIEAYYDGQRAITARDATFRGPGLVGVWTKADSVTYFDDLVVQGVAAAT